MLPTVFLFFNLLILMVQRCWNESQYIIALRAHNLSSLFNWRIESLSFCKQQIFQLENYKAAQHTLTLWSSGPRASSRHLLNQYIL